MIYFWFPGFQASSQEIDITSVQTPSDDYSPKLSTIRTKIIVRNPDWIADQAKAQNVIVKRAMNDTVRSYVTNDRKDMDMRFCALHFEGLRNERRIALEHFMLCAEGSYVGYKDPYGKCHIIVFTENDTQFVQQGRAGGGVRKLDVSKEVVDEHATVDLAIAIVRTYDSVTIDG